MVEPSSYTSPHSSMFCLGFLPISLSISCCSFFFALLFCSRVTIVWEESASLVQLAASEEDEVSTQVTARAPVHQVSVLAALPPSSPSFSDSPLLQATTAPHPRVERRRFHAEVSPTIVLRALRRLVRRDSGTTLWVELLPLDQGRRSVLLVITVLRASRSPVLLAPLAPQRVYTLLPAPAHVSRASTAPLVVSPLVRWSVGDRMSSVLEVVGLLTLSYPGFTLWEVVRSASMQRQRQSVGRPMVSWQTPAPCMVQ